MVNNAIGEGHEVVSTMREEMQAHEQLPLQLRKYITETSPSRFSSKETLRYMREGARPYELIRAMRTMSQQIARDLYGPDYPADLAGKPLKR